MRGAFGLIDHTYISSLNSARHAFGAVLLLYTHSEIDLIYSYFQK